MEQIKVFISSAMSSELNGALDWGAIRIGVAQGTRDSRLFDVFNIEGHASPDPSNQYMLSQVERCDVFVLILGHELRTGTKQEYKKAIELHKDMLIYVYDINHDAECKALIDEVQRNDYCCYRKVKITDNMGNIVASDLREHVIRRYLGHSMPRPIETSSHKGTEMPHFGTATIQCFGNAALTLGQRLGYPYHGQVNDAEAAPLSETGSNLIDWFLGGSWTPLAERSELLKKELLETGLNNEEIELISLRWQACDYYMCGRTGSAIEILEKAASHGQDKTQVLTGTLIDLRNLVTKRDGTLAGHNLQEVINQRGSRSYVPVGDTFLHLASNSLREAEDSDWIKPARAIILGEHRLGEVLLNISNALFANALFGSIAGIEHVRLDCAKLLMRFSRLYDDKDLYVEGLLLCAFGGYFRELEKWLDAGFEFANQQIIARADKLWDATRAQDMGTIDECGCVVFSSLGMYLDNRNFSEACRVFLGGTNILKNGAYGETAFGKAISRNAHRMNPGLLVHLISLVVSEQHPHSVEWLNTTTGAARLGEASKEDRSELACVLEERYDWLVKHGLSPSRIATLAKKYAEFSKLGNFVKSNLSGFDLIEYELNECNGTLNDSYASSLISGAKDQLALNDNPRRQSEFGTKPARYLADIITAQSFPIIREAIESEITELWNQLADSNAPGLFLDDYIWLAIRMVVVYRESESPLPDGYKTLARVLKNKQPPIDSGFLIYGRKTWDIRVATYRLLTGVEGKRAFLDGISDIWDADISTREACVECLEAYLQANQGVAFRDMMTIVSSINMLSRDRDARVRQKAARCAIRLLDTKADSNARTMMLHLARDPQPNVRAQLLRSAAESYGHSDTLHELARYLENDAHFEIRTMARKVLEQMKTQGD